MDKSCVPVAKLALSQKKYWHCWQSTYCIWSCSENFHCWVLPGMGLFRQQFETTIFDFGNMWQPRIWYLDTDALGVNELVSSFFSMLLRSSTSMDARQFLQLWNTPPALHPVAKCFADSKKTFIAFGEMQGTDRKPWFLHDPVEGSVILVSQIHGQKMEDFNDGFGLPSKWWKHCTKFRWVSGVFGANGSFELKRFRVFVGQEFNTTHCHIVRCQHRETRFREFPTFQSSLAEGRWWGSQKHYLGFLQISTIPLRFGGCLILSSISISKTSKVSTDYMASSTTKMRQSRNFQFLYSLWQLGFFLNVNLSSFETHHQPCTLLQSASLFQLHIGAFGEKKLQKLLDPSSFWEYTPAPWAVCAIGGVRVGELLHLGAST